MRYLFIFLVLASSAAFAGTFTAADCNQSSVNTLINGPTHTAVDGDVIIIPGGSCTWTSGITVNNIGITIKGTGTPNSTPSTTGASASCTATIITDNINGGNAFSFRPSVSSSLSRLSCLQINSTAASTIGAPVALAGHCNSSTCSNVRMDNITLDASLSAQPLGGTRVPVDNIFGVLDHNTSNTASGSSNRFIGFQDSAWQGVGDWGDNSFAALDTMGTSQTLYVENNLLTGDGLLMTENESQTPGGNQGGGRIVLRFNNCNGCYVGLAFHGTESNGRPRSGRQAEFYDNTFLCAPTGQSAGAGCEEAGFRGGVGILFGNTLIKGAGTWFNQYLGLNTYRVTFPSLSSVWQPCPGPWDSSSPTICLDEPGRSGGTYLSGTAGTGGGPTPLGWANEVIDPIYEFNDTGGTTIFSTVNSDWSGVAANRDYYTDNSNGSPQQQTSPTSPFNGTSGVGIGTLANRPTTCTPGPSGAPGVGYWSTNSGPNWNQGTSGGQLFACSSSSSPTWQQGGTNCVAAGGNFWCLYYTPYTYPHPLISGGGPSFSVSPSTVPAHHSGNITLTLSGAGTAWVQGSTIFSLSALTGLTKVSQNITSVTAATIVVTTGSGTGTSIISDSTDVASAGLLVQTAALSISPSSGTVNTTPTLNLTCSQCVWTQETAAGLFTESGGTGASIGTPSIISNSSATAVLTTGSAITMLTITDTSTTAAATFSVTSAAAPTVATITATGITATGATSGGTWTCTGSCTSNPNSEGVCYATTINPAVGSSTCTSDGTTTPFTSTLSGLNNNVLYHYRAYAQNSIGVAYGSDLTFTTLSTCPLNQAIGAYTLCGQGFANANGTTISVNYSPNQGNGVIITTAWCFTSDCKSSVANVTATIGDNLHSPVEPCFTKSPHSPMTSNSNGGGQGSGDFEGHYIWYCPSIPAGVTSFTVNLSAAQTAPFLISVSEWKTGSLSTTCSPATACWESNDNVSNAGTASTTATIVSNGPTATPNDLIYAATEIPFNPSQTATVGAGYTLISNPSINTGFVAEAKAVTGIQTPNATATVTYGISGTWFGVIGGIIGIGQPPIASFSPTSLNFGSVGTNVTSPPITVTLMNTGASVLNLSSIAMQTATVFSISSSTCGATLSVNASCVVSIVFSPVATGVQSDNIVFTDNATNSPQSISVTGTGIASPSSQGMIISGIQRIKGKEIIQ